MVPLQNVDVSSRVIDFVSEVNVVQTYINSFDSPLETTYDVMVISQHRD